MNMNDDIETLKEKVFALEANNRKLVEELKYKKEYVESDIAEKTFEVLNSIQQQLKESINKALSE